MEKSELLKIAEIVSVEHPTFEFVDSAGKTTPRFQLWQSTFGKFPYEVIARAVKVHLLRSPFAPKISEIATIIKAGRSIEEQSAEAAFLEMQKAVSKYGIYQELKAKLFLSPACRRAVDVLGWREVCASSNPEALRAHFLKIYTNIQAKKENRRELNGVVKSMKAAGLIEDLAARKGIEQ